MSANKGIETKIHDDENADSGFLSGNIEQESCDLEAHEESEGSSDDRKVSSELDDKIINPDSGVGLCEAGLEALHVDSVTEPRICIPLPKESTDKDIPPLAILFQQDDDGDTQLHIAAVHGCEKSVGTLIRVCPDRYWLDLPNDYGHTALHLAVMSRHPVVTRMLVLAGASIAVRDLNGNTPIHAATAVRSVDCLQALLRPVENQRVPKTLASLLNMINYNGQTCVHIAAKSGHLDTLKILVRCGADVNAMEGYAGWTALHIAAHRGDLALMQFLAQKCPRVAARARDYAGRTPRRVAKRVHAFSPEKKQKIFDILPEESDSDTDDDDEDEVPRKRARTAERSAPERRRAHRSSAETGTTT